MTHEDRVHDTCSTLDSGLRRRAGFPASHRRNSRTRFHLSGTRCVKSFETCPRWLAEPGSGLALCWVSKNVFRAAVLSIVLTLMAGPNASLLCAVWCHPEAATAGSCEHPNPTSTPNVAAKDSCPDITAASTTFVREDVRRGVSSPQAHRAVAVASFQLAPPATQATPNRHAAPAAALEARPLVLALRI